MSSVSKYIVFVFSLLFLLVFTLFYPQNGDEIKTAHAFAYGDVNGDHRVDSRDASAVLSEIVRLERLAPPSRRRADVAFDQQVGLNDVILILKYAAGHIDEFPAEKVNKDAVKIVGEPKVSVWHAQQWARSRNAHDRFIDIAPTYWEYGEKTGIRPDILYAQSAKETAFGNYGGVVEPDFNNWAGIKIEEGGPCGDPDAHEKFDTAKDGVRAHFNHVTAYVGKEPVGEPHGRYHTVMTVPWACTIRYVEQLGGRWAPSETYGDSVVEDYLHSLENY